MFWSNAPIVEVVLGVPFSYDANREDGLPIVYVNPKGTSSLCPVCGGKLAPNGHRLLKCECGYENDRDITACLNMLRMRGAPLPPKALHEPLTVEARGKDENL